MLILVAVDGSQSASRAVEFAAQLARKLDGTLKILHVIEPWELPDPVLNYTLWKRDPPGGSLFDSSRSILNEAQKDANRLGAPKVETVSLLGVAATTIITVARRERADVIVLGKRGRGKLSGMLLGSVSRKVMTAAPCQVVVVP